MRPGKTSARLKVLRNEGRWGNKASTILLKVCRGNHVVKEWSGSYGAKKCKGIVKEKDVRVCVCVWGDSVLGDCGSQSDEGQEIGSD